MCNEEKKKVVELGGPAIIGTERHESRRIDNQLRGRAGRQGDPGSSVFYVSFEDELIRRFGGDRIQSMVRFFKIDEDTPFQVRILTKSIETAQKRIEGYNFSIRHNVLKFDNVLNEQREIIYARRNEILDQENIRERTLNTFKNNIITLVDSHIEPEGYLTENDKSEIVEYINTNLIKKSNLKLEDILNIKDEDEIINILTEKVINNYEEKMKSVPDEIRNEFEKAIALRVIDSAWIEHISSMEHLRDGIGLRGYAQTNPLQAYTMEGYEMFDNLLNNIDSKISLYLLKAEITQNTERKQTIVGKAQDGKEKLKSTPKTSKKIGRNDPCPCGSGKKYKNCCGK